MIEDISVDINILFSFLNDSNIVIKIGLKNDNIMNKDKDLTILALEESLYNKFRAISG